MAYQCFVGSFSCLADNCKSGIIRINKGLKWLFSMNESLEAVNFKNFLEFLLSTAVNTVAYPKIR